MADSKTVKLKTGDETGKKATIKTKKEDLVSRVENATGSTSGKGSSSARLKGEIKYIEKSVTDAKGRSGSYIYYKDPKKDKNFNVETDREFVTKGGMRDVAAKTPEFQKYKAQEEAKKKKTP